MNTDMTNQGLGFRSAFICVNRRRTFLAVSLLGVMVLPAQEQPARKSHIDDLVAGARAKVAKAPERAESYVELANALLRRAREKSDPAFDREAEDALNKALHLQAGNFEAR
ncbi:MAG: hypothetical protein JWO80_3086, partial [Bryobacterales bacterium]|nr:hypothetical protein [Bryobacterales bacterium]